MDDTNEFTTLKKAEIDVEDRIRRLQEQISAKKARLRKAKHELSAQSRKERVRRLIEIGTVTEQILGADIDAASVSAILEKVAALPMTVNKDTGESKLVFEWARSVTRPDS